MYFYCRKKKVKQFAQREEINIDLNGQWYIIFEKHASSMLKIFFDLLL